MKLREHSFGALWARPCSTPAGDVVKSGKSHNIFPGKILWYTVDVVESDESQRNVLGTLVW